MSDLGRNTPQAVDAEQSVLGSLLIDLSAAARVDDILAMDDFYRKQHEVIYEAALALYRQRQPIDLTTLREELQRRGELDSIGGPGYLAQLMNSVPTAVHVEHYAHMVAHAARRRRLIATAGKIAAAGYEESDADEAEDRAMALMLETVARNKSGIEVLTPSQQGDLLIEMLESRQQGSSPGILTGIRTLDAATGGLRRGDLVVLAARPSAGKSSMAESVAENIARAGGRVAFVSVEMDKTTVMHRFAARSGRLPVKALVSGPTHDADWHTIYELAEQRTNTPLTLFNAPSATTNSIRAGLLKEQMKSGQQWDLVVVDYLQLLSDPLVKGQSGADRIGWMTRSMKNLAREMKAPVLLLSQLNRESEHRSDREPQLSDLRGSGDIEQDADLVVFLWTTDSENAPPDTFVKIGKQRNGPIGDLEGIYFDRPRFLFRDAA